MKWNAEHRRYEDAKGHPISPAELREDIDFYIASEQVEIDTQAAELRTGALTVAAFFLFLREKIAAMHGATAMVAYGGAEEMNPNRWALVGQRIHEELEFLKKFEQEVEKAYQTSETIASEITSHVIRSPEVPDALDKVVQDRVMTAITNSSVTELDAVVSETIREVITDVAAPETVEALVTEVSESIIDPAGARLEEMIWGNVSNRSQSYGDAAFSTFENSVKQREADAGATLARRVCEDDSRSCEDCPQLATEEYVPLDQIEDIGESACGNACRCYFEFSFQGVTEVGGGESLTLEDDEIP